MKMLIDGKWREADKTIEVRNPYDNALIDTVPDANEEDVEEAIESALKGYQGMKALSAYERSQILKKVSERLNYGPMPVK